MFSPSNNHPSNAHCSCKNCTCGPNCKCTKTQCACESSKRSFHTNNTTAATTSTTATILPSSVASAMNENKNKTTTNPLHAMVAGYLAGSSGTIVGYPLDSLKVWVQTNTMGKNQHLESNQTKKRKGPKDSSRRDSKKQSFKVSGSRRSNSTKAIYSNSATTTSRSVLSYSFSSSSSASSLQRTTNRLVSRYLTKPAWTVARTLRALYSGVSGPLVTVGMVQSVNFATYDATRRFLYNRQHPEARETQDYLTKDSLRNVAMAGSCGGVVMAMVTAPLLMIKIHQQITGDSFRRAIKEIFFVKDAKGARHFQPLRPYGPAFVPHAFSESLGRIIYVSTYEGSKRYLLSLKPDREGLTTQSLSLRERMACAATSGITCWGIFFPFDALRNNMYHQISRGRKASILETVLKMKQDRAFYRGFSISILRAGPVAASVLPVYDLTLEWLSSASK